MLVLGLLLFSVLSLLLYPLFKHEAFDLMYLDYIEDERETLKRQKANYVLIIKELDFDYETEKLSKEDYKTLRKKYEQEAVELMKKIEISEAQWNKHLHEVEQNIKRYESEQGHA